MYNIYFQELLIYSLSYGWDIYKIWWPMHVMKLWWFSTDKITKMHAYILLLWLLNDKTCEVWTSTIIYVVCKFIFYYIYIYIYVCMYVCLNIFILFVCVVVWVLVFFILSEFFVMFTQIAIITAVMLFVCLCDKWFLLLKGSQLLPWE